MESLRHTFRNNGLGEYNDDVFEQLFDLSGKEYILKVYPNKKTKFWRFGIRLSKTDNIEFYSPEGRYIEPGFKKFIDIHLGVGNWDRTLDAWSSPRNISLAQYNLFEDPLKHVLDNSETYTEFGKVEWMIKYIQEQKSLYVSYEAEGCKAFSASYPLNSEYKYFKVFAWADATDFEIECTIDKLETQSFSNSIAANQESNEPNSYDLRITKKVAETLKKGLNGLIQKYKDWYEISENTHEDQFGNAIANLLKIIDTVLSTKENNHPTLNPRLLVALTTANTAALGLIFSYQKREDQDIIKEFGELLKWGLEMVKNITDGHPDLVTDYTGVLEDGEDSNDNAPIQEADKNTVDFKTLRGRLLSDQATENDLLGFSVYAAAIAELIKTNIIEQNKNEQKEAATKSTDTKAGKPFNIGIIAPWGHGKTTLMKNVQRELDPGYKHSDEDIENKLKSNDNNTTSKKTTYKQVWKYICGKELKNEEKIDSRFPSIWFNAWRYQSSDQIWAGLGHAIITQLSSRLSDIEQEKFWFKLQLSRVDTMKMKKEFYSDLIRKLLPWLITTGIAFIVSLVYFIIKKDWQVSSYISLIGLIPTFIGYFKSYKDKIEGKISVYFDEPDYSEKLGVYHNIIHDLHKVFSLVLKDNQRAVIFIDDLDRCSPNVIGDVFEAVNLMMVDPVIGKHCYFIFGMDAQVVAAALDNKYALMSGKLKEQEEAFGSVGWYFLDKFIQLPFNVPIMSQDERLDLLKYYFEPEKLTHQNKTENKSKGDKEEAINNVKEAMQETNTEEKQKKLAKVLSNIDDKNIEVKKEAVKEAVKEKLKDDDSEEIISQLKFITPFLSSSPREIIRYINLLRFFNSTLFIRQSMMPSSIQTDFKGVAKYLLIALKWPQLVRWIQWEGDNELVMYNTTKDKAKFLDEVITSFRTGNESIINIYSELKNAESPDDTAIQKSTEDLYNIWDKHCDIKLKYDIKKTNPKKLPWLYDKQIMEVLLHEDTLKSTFEHALLCKMW